MPNTSLQGTYINLYNVYVYREREKERERTSFDSNKVPFCKLTIGCVCAIVEKRSAKIVFPRWKIATYCLYVINDRFCRPNERTAIFPSISRHLGVFRLFVQEGRGGGKPEVGKRGNYWNRMEFSDVNALFPPVKCRRFFHDCLNKYINQHYRECIQIRISFNYKI